MRQVRDGLAGGASAVLPLLVVNVLGYLGLLDSQEALVAGALALLGGPLLGGIVAGLLGSQTRRSATTLGSGIVAAALYLAALVVLVVAAGQIGAEPLILAEHPLRVGGAMIMLATLLAFVALGVGALARRRAWDTSSAARRPGLARGMGTPTATRRAAPIGARDTRGVSASRAATTARERTSRPTSGSHARATRSSSALPSERRR